MLIELAEKKYEMLQEVQAYLHDDLVEINARKRERIDEYVARVKPQCKTR